VNVNIEFCSTVGTNVHAQWSVHRISKIANIVVQRWRKLSSCRETERNREHFSISRKSGSAHRSRRSRLATRNCDNRGVDKVGARHKGGSGASKGMRESASNHELTLFITVLRASFAPGSFSHSHHDTIAYSRGMKSTLLNSFFLTPPLSLSLCLSRFNVDSQR